MAVKYFYQVLLAIGLMLIAEANAQQMSYPEGPMSHVEVGAGAGFSEPFGRAGNNVDTGWNLDFRGGYKPSRNVAIDLDFNYNRWNLNSAALARFGEPGGYTTIWSFSLLPTLRGSPHWHVMPYVFGGPGVYYRNLTLTTPTTTSTIFCDPFFGFCYPTTIGVNQVVASSTTYKGGVSAGAGLEFPIGQSRLKAFGEARYARMFTTHGTDLEYVPVTFGIRW